MKTLTIRGSCALALLLVASGGATTAHAVRDDKLVCVFYGSTGPFAGGASIPNAVASGRNAFTPPVVNVMARYGYTLTARANCAGYDATTGTVITPNTAVADPTLPTWGNTGFTSTGTFDNIICGTAIAEDPWTGPADGTATITVAAPGVAPVSRFGYRIALLAGQGAIVDSGGDYHITGFTEVSPTAPFPFGASGNCVWDGDLTPNQPEDGVNSADLVGFFVAADL